MWRSIKSVEKKYGVEPTNGLLIEGMRHGFERMCIIHDSIITMHVRHFSIYIHVYYLFYFSLLSATKMHSIHFIFMFADGRWTRRGQQLSQSTKHYAK